MFALAMDCFLAGIAVLLWAYAVSWIWHKGAYAMSVKRGELAIALIGVWLAIYLSANFAFNLCILWSMWD